MPHRSGFSLTSGFSVFPAQKSMKLSSSFRRGTMEELIRQHSPARLHRISLTLALSGKIFIFSLNKSVVKSFEIMAQFRKSRKTI
jgi:hypothetical protein